MKKRQNFQFSMKSGVIFVVQGALHFSGQAISPGPESNYGGFVLTGASAPDPVAATNDNRLSDSLICGRAF